MRWVRWVRFGAVIDVNERQLPAPLDHLRYLEEQGRVTAIEGGTAEVVPRPGCLDPEGRYWRLCLPGPAVKVDIFVLDEACWGLGFPVRTGSAEFSQGMLARWKARSGGSSRRSPEEGSCARPPSIRPEEGVARLMR